MRARNSLVLLLVVAAGCASFAGGVVPTAEQVAAESEMDPDALRSGRSLYTRMCMDCHRQYFPDEYSPGAWESILPIMGDRAGLTELETHNVTLFLTEAARMTRTPPGADTTQPE